MIDKVDSNIGDRIEECDIQRAEHNKGIREGKIVRKMIEYAKNLMQGKDNAWS